MLEAEKGRISDILVNAYKALHNPWACVSVTSRARHYRLRPEAEDALNALPDDEALLCSSLPLGILAVLRSYGRPKTEKSRKRFRRMLRRAPETQRDAFKRLRSAADALTGSTRPIKPVSLLCFALREHAGLTDTEIARLLDTAGIEPIETDEDGFGLDEARMRIRERIKRARMRAS